MALSAMGAPALAGAQSLCRQTAAGPLEYQLTLAPLVSGFVLAPGGHGEAPPPPPASTGVGAGNLAREALGAQFAGVWLSNDVQGWVVGLAAGPLDPAAARTAIIERVAAHYTAAETAHLTERLHVDPQPYSDADLLATQDAVTATLAAEAPGIYWIAYVACTLSDARRVEVLIFPPSTSAERARVSTLLEPFGDRVRVELASGAPALTNLPGPPPPSSTPAVVLGRHVRMPTALRCVRGHVVRIAARRSQPAVRSLSVRVAGRARTIAGRRLAKPLTVALRGRRTRVVVTVRLADGRAGTRTVTYTRCR